MTTTSWSVSERCGDTNLKMIQQDIAQTLSLSELGLRELGACSCPSDLNRDYV